MKGVPVKRIIIVLFAFIALCVALTSPYVLNTIVNFVFLGLIPGTDITVPFWLMLIAFIAVTILLIRWLTNQPLYIGSLASQEQTARQIARKKIAKKVSAAHRSRRQPVKLH